MMCSTANGLAEYDRSARQYSQQPRARSTTCRFSAELGLLEDIWWFDPKLSPHRLQIHAP